VGAWSIKAVVAETAFRNLKVIDAREVPIEAGEPETLVERRAAALAELLADPSLKTDVSVAAMPGEEVATRTLELPFIDQKKVDQVIGGELADVIPFDIDDAVFDHRTLRKTDAGRSISLAAATPIPRIRARLDLLEGAGLNPKHLLVDAFQLAALYTAYLADDGSKPEEPLAPSGEAETFVQPTPDGPAEARLLVDVGHGRTVVCACNDDGVAHARVLRAGGRDVTEALAKVYEGELPEIEAMKHQHGFVASSRHPVPDDETQPISDAVAEGLKPLVRELRRTLQIIRKERKVRIGRIDLLGGGSRLRNLAPYLAEQLNVPAGLALAVDQAVERNIDAARRSAFGLALALAMRPANPQASPRIDLRVGEFAFSGQLEQFRARLPFMAAAGGGLLLLLLVSVAANYRAIIEREAQVDQAFCTITKEVVGQEICEPSRAISVMKSPSSELGTFQLPEVTAYTIAAELSHRVPEELNVKLYDIDVTPDRARIEGEADSFDTVDKLVASYSDSECLSDIKKDEIRKKSAGDGIEFKINMQVTCS
jgi:general secretion pathway protein L